MKTMYVAAAMAVLAAMPSRACATSITLYGVVDAGVTMRSVQLKKACGKAASEWRMASTTIASSV